MMAVISELAKYSGIKATARVGRPRARRHQSELSTSLAQTATQAMAISRTAANRNVDWPSAIFTCI